MFVWLLQVSAAEGRTLAVQHGCQWAEVSVAENSEQIYQSIDQLVSECRAAHKHTRKFSVSKMLGTLIGGVGGAGGGGGAAAAAAQGAGTGTVVACHKSDLHRSRVLRRRQNFIATASL